MRTRKPTLPTPDLGHCKCTNINDSEPSEWHTLYIKIRKSDTSIQTPLYLAAWVERKNLKKTFLPLTQYPAHFIPSIFPLSPSGHPSTENGRNLLSGAAGNEIMSHLTSSCNGKSDLYLAPFLNTGGVCLFYFAFAFAYTVHSLAGSLA